MAAGPGIRTVLVVPPDLNSALSLLPEPYGRAMRLLIDGASPDEVATTLSVDPSAIGSLLEVAEAKLRELLLADVTPPEGA